MLFERDRSFQNCFFVTSGSVMLGGQLLKHLSILLDKQMRCQVSWVSPDAASRAQLHCCARMTCYTNSGSCCMQARCNTEAAPRPICCHQVDVRSSQRLCAMVVLPLEPDIHVDSSSHTQKAPKQASIAASRRKTAVCRRRRCHAEMPLVVSAPEDTLSARAVENTLERPKEHGPQPLGKVCGIWNEAQAPQVRTRELDLGAWWPGGRLDICQHCGTLPTLVQKHVRKQHDMIRT